MTSKKISIRYIIIDISPNDYSKEPRCFYSKEPRNQGKANANIPKFLNSLDIKKKKEKYKQSWIDNILIRY